ncbi:hypothetical protein [Kitasatospora sp. NPDC058190]|uniref:hypothetical protein n=1 Tax=Kitasatospora sp. NPDC058190 TaxID=3346371 RepID=UPI0036DECFAC
MVSTGAVAAGSHRGTLVGCETTLPVGATRERRAPRPGAGPRSVWGRVVPAACSA